MYFRPLFHGRPFQKIVRVDFLVLFAPSGGWNPRNTLGEFDVMLEKSSLMLLIHWANIPYISLVLGRGVTRVEVGCLLDFLFLPMLGFLLFP